MAAFTGPCGIHANGGSQLQRYLNTSIADVKLLCLLASINKWSKKKPVRVAQYASLTEAQFKSAGGSGYMYGVRARYLSTTTLADLHSFTYDYERPNDYYRLDDFYGYDKDAKADVSGTLPDEAYRDLLGFTVLVDVDYLRTNTTGIPIMDLMKEELSMSGATDEAAFSYIYPFLLVGGYMCCLKNARTGDNDYGDSQITPICHNGVWYSDFIADIQALNAISTIPLGTSTPFTVFLMRVMANDPITTPWLDGAWRAISGIGGSQVTSVYAYPLPNAVGRYLTVKDAFEYPPQLMFTMPTTANSRGFNIGYAFASTPKEDVIVNYSVRVTPTAGTPVTGSFTYTPGGTNLASIGVSWTALGMVGAPASGTLLQVDITATYYYSSDPNQVHAQTSTASGGLIVQL